MCVAWSMALQPPWNPYIIFSRGSLLYVYDVVVKGLVGAIRGHGGVSRSNTTLLCIDRKVLGDNVHFCPPG